VCLIVGGPGALLFRLNIVREAASRLSEATRSERPAVPRRGIIEVCNHVAHGLHSVDLRIVPDVLQDDLATLRTIIDSWLAEAAAPWILLSLSRQDPSSGWTACVSVSARQREAVTSGAVAKPEDGISALRRDERAGLIRSLLADLEGSPDVGAERARIEEAR
jgi:hypothetical protein